MSTLLIVDDDQKPRHAAKAEWALKESEALFRAIASVALDGIVLMAPDGAISFWNASAELIFGYSESETLGRKLDEFLVPNHPSGAEHAFPDWQAMGQQGKPVRRVVELLGLRKDGTTFAAELSLASVCLHDRWHAGAIVRDLTYLHLAEERLRTLSRAVEQSPASIVITDTKGRIEYVNPEFTSVTGYEVAEVLGKNPRVLKSGKMPTEVYEVLWGRLTSGQEWRGEMHNRRKNGELYWEAAVISPIKGENGETTHFLAVKEDITERKQAEAERVQNEIHSRQAQKLESIGQLAAGIAHEINTPMQYIGDNTRFLQDAFKDLCRVVAAVKELTDHPESQPGLKNKLAPVEDLLRETDVEYLLAEIPKAIGQSLEGTGHITKIVQAMKEFSHPGSRQKAAVDLNHAIECTLTVARNEYKYVAEVETDFDPGLPFVPCLPGEFNQVILNLVVNAAHAIADVVGANSGRMGRIVVSTRRDRDWVEVRITDTGTGIPEAIRTRLFDPFFTTKAPGKGTGQGLPIARSVVVDKHGGTLTFETEIGRGTTFIIRLPLRQSTTRSAGKSQDPEDESRVDPHP